MQPDESTPRPEDSASTLVGDAGEETAGQSPRRRSRVRAHPGAGAATAAEPDAAAVASPSGVLASGEGAGPSGQEPSAEAGGPPRLDVEPAHESATVDDPAGDEGDGAAPDVERAARRRRGRRNRRPEGRLVAGEAEPPVDEADDGAGGGLAIPDAPAAGSQPVDAPRPTVRSPFGEADPDAESPDREGDPSPRAVRDETSGEEREGQGVPAERGPRGDGRRREWREPRDGAEGRDYREGGRPPRDRQFSSRDRGYQPGRDGRQNGMGPRDQTRDGHAAREPRDLAGYREGQYRDAPSRDRFPEGYSRGEPYSSRQQPAASAGPDGEAARPARPPDVVTRGYVVAIDQNQTQWQLRTHGHLPSPQDAVIPGHVVRNNGLRTGDEVVGLVRTAAAGRRFGELLDVQSINGVTLDRLPVRPRFDDLTPIYPDRHMRLERPDSVTARLIDIIAPIGFGQRALVVSPPKAGKTTILKEIGRSVNVNYPQVRLIVCLVGERPEEVTDLAKSLDGEVISSTFDEAINHHTELAEITIDRAKRLVESGFDVVVLLDSVTRLARAYNLAAPGDSRSLSGGMATSALYPPKRFFGAARALQEGGSLTVIATCLVDTNSRLDDVIYEELKGTGNMELVLDRRLAEDRVFPAVDIVKSSTRREELLLGPNELMAVHRLRRALSMATDSVGGTRNVIQQMERTKTNAEFLATLLTQSSRG